MPPVGKLNALPDETRDELNRLLVEYRYGRLAEVRSWLEEQGITVSVATVGRHSQELRAKMERRMEKAMVRLECAKALRGMSPEEKVALLESNEMAAIDAVMDMWDEWAEVPKEDRPKYLPALVKASAALSDSARGTARLRKEVESEVVAKSAEAAEAAASQSGVTPEGIAAIRAAIMGGLS